MLVNTPILEVYWKFTKYPWKVINYRYLNFNITGIMK